MLLCLEAPLSTHTLQCYVVHVQRRLFLPWHCLRDWSYFERMIFWINRSLAFLERFDPTFHGDSLTTMLKTSGMYWTYVSNILIVSMTKLNVSLTKRGAIYHSSVRQCERRCIVHLLKRDLLIAQHKTYLRWTVNEFKAVAIAKCACNFFLMGNNDDTWQYLAKLRGCVQRPQVWVWAKRLSMRRIIAMKIQASSLLGSTS